MTCTGPSFEYAGSLHHGQYRLSTQDRSRVIGVQTRNRTEEGHAITATIQADLVVDASGRHSQAPQRLMELGTKLHQ